MDSLDSRLQSSSDMEKGEIKESSSKSSKESADAATLTPSGEGESDSDSSSVTPTGSKKPTQQDVTVTIKF